jgi:alpha-D-ribose 1-methylphosphonate 5-triphosphate synthase subunit PhnL
MMIEARGIAKTFTLHLQGGVKLNVLRDASIAARAGECVAISGPSGAGKSTLLRALYGNYLVDAGEILVRHKGLTKDIVAAPAETLLDIRRETLGYVSQFLRAIPRVSALDIVAARAVERGMAAPEARRAGTEILGRLGIAARLQGLLPATFSGGEQQRVNIARAFVCPWPVLLLDEPTASLDAANRDIVVALMQEAKAQGAAIIGIFHDLAVREAIADKVVTLQPVREIA